MARMPDFEAEAEEAVAAARRYVLHGVNHLLRHPDTSAEPAAATATIEHSTQEAPVSKFSDDLHAIASKVEHIDDEAITALTAVKANPATATGLALLHELTGYNVSPDFITLGLSVLTELRDRLKAAATPGPDGQPQPSFQPAGPVVAGQA